MLAGDAVSCESRHVGPATTPGEENVSERLRKRFYADTHDRSSCMDAVQCFEMVKNTFWVPRAMDTGRRRPMLRYLRVMLSGDTEAVLRFHFRRISAASLEIFEVPDSEANNDTVSGRYMA